MNSLSPLRTCAAAILAVLLAGCASADQPSAPEAKPTREFRTGSNIPVKDPAPATTQEERDRSAEQIRSIQRTGAGGKPGG